MRAIRNHPPRQVNPWNHKTTLCIATACRDKGKARIVVATDAKTGTHAEALDTFFWINNNVPMLVVGAMHRAADLRDTITDYLDRHYQENPEPGSTTEKQAFELVKRAVATFKQGLAGEHTARRFGLGYSQFRSEVRCGRIDARTANETMHQISNIHFGCGLILPFFWDGKPRIYRIDALGTVEQCPNFAAIGPMATIAESVLYHRKHEAQDALGPSVYRVFEAMKLGSMTSGDGQGYTLSLLYPPGERNKDLTLEMLAGTAKRFLECRFRELGPKPFVKMNLPKGAFQLGS